MVGILRGIIHKLPSPVRRRVGSTWRERIAGPVSASVVRRGLSIRDPEVRGAIFDAMPAGSLLLADTGEEIFAVLRDDEVVARSMFMSGVPFELGNISRAHALVRRTHGVKRLVDIGANLGSVSVAAVKRGLVERADAIEPEPQNFRLLSANVHLNAIEDRVTCYRVALGDEDGATLQFALSKGNFGDHRVAATLADPSRDHQTTIALPSCRLDSLLTDLDAATTMLWMDVQGYEGQVLAGAPRILAGRPPLVLEFWPSALASTAGFPLLRRALLEANYSRFHILNGDLEPIPLTPASLDGLHDRLLPTPDQVDLLFI